MRQTITLNDAPEIREAYAEGLRMACEIIEWRMSTLPLLLRPFAAREGLQAIASLRQSAELIDAEASRSQAGGE